MEFKDYYKIMNLPRSASAEEIKRAYRKLAKKYHPDVSKEPKAEEKFKELGEAYEVLRDPEKRAAYDQVSTGHRHGERFTPPPGWGAGFDFGGFSTGDAAGFSDFFESLFGRATADQRHRPSRSAWAGPMRGEDQQARIQIALEDAYTGGKQTITLQSAPTVGRVQAEPVARTLNIKIPKGVKEGQRIRLVGQGGMGIRGGANGDLYLEVHYKPHRLFRAEGSDIYLELPVTPWEAALGGTLSVPTLAGKIELKLPPNSQSGQKLRLKARGLDGNPPGDQYVVIRVIVPEASTPEAKTLYKSMAEIMPMNPRAYMG
jgi:curved DNA-binding protein